MTRTPSDGPDGVPALVSDTVSFLADTLDDLTVELLHNLEAVHLAMPMDSTSALDLQRLLLRMETAHGTVHALASAVRDLQRPPQEPFDPSEQLLRLRPLLHAVAGSGWTVQVRGPLGIALVPPQAVVLDGLVLDVARAAGTRARRGELLLRVSLEDDGVHVSIEGLTGDTSDLCSTLAGPLQAEDHPVRVLPLPGGIEVRLPRAAPSSRRSPDWSVPGSTSLLLVDDDEAIRDGLVPLLRSSGYDVRTAHSAEQALDSLSERTVDVLVTDLVLPSMNGMALAVLARRRRPGLPVLLISGFRRYFDHLGGTIGIGPTRFLSKPFTPDEVMDAVSRLQRGSTRAPGQGPQG